MRLCEIAKPQKQRGRRVRTYLIKVKIKGKGYTNIVKTTVTAVNPQMARKLARLQYNNNPNVLVGTPKEIRLK